MRPARSTYPGIPLHLRGEGASGVLRMARGAPPGSATPATRSSTARGAYMDKNEQARIRRLTGPESTPPRRYFRDATAAASARAAGGAVAPSLAVLTGSYIPAGPYEDLDRHDGRRRTYSCSGRSSSGCRERGHEGRGHGGATTRQTLDLLRMHKIDHFAFGSPRGRLCGPEGSRRSYSATTAMRRFGHARKFRPSHSPHGSNDLALAAAVAPGSPRANTFDYEFAVQQHNVGCRLAKARARARTASRPSGSRRYGVGPQKLVQLPGPQGGVLPVRLPAGRGGGARCAGASTAIE